MSLLTKLKRWLRGGDIEMRSVTESTRNAKRELQVSSARLSNVSDRRDSNHTLAEASDGLRREASAALSRFRRQQQDIRP